VVRAVHAHELVDDTGTTRSTSAAEEEVLVVCEGHTEHGESGCRVCMMSRARHRAMVCFLSVVVKAIDYQGKHLNDEDVE
jgi:hypothetical protein